MQTDVNESFGFVIHDVARLLRWSFDRQDLELTRAQWSVLAHLHRGDGIQQKSLARIMDIAPITLARHLDHLEVDAWIERRDDPSDRRAKRVYLTPKAAPMLSKLQDLGQVIRTQALKGINKEDEAVFISTLLRIRENLSKADR